MRAYKVLKKRKGRLQSCTVEGKDIAVTYARGKVSHAPEWLAEKGYHLCVFKRIQEARRFTIDHHSSSDRIWLANVRGIISMLPTMLNTDLISRKSSMNDIHSWQDWPFGTIMVKSVTLVKEIKERGI